MTKLNDFITNGSGVVTLCGSTKFYEEYTEANRILTLKNWIVLSVGKFGNSIHKDVENSVEEYETVKQLHFCKIWLSGLVVICTDDDHYMGSSTIAELTIADTWEIPWCFYTLKGGFEPIHNWVEADGYPSLNYPKFNSEIEKLKKVGFDFGY